MNQTNVRSRIVCVKLTHKSHNIFLNVSSVFAVDWIFESKERPTMIIYQPMQPFIMRLLNLHMKQDQMNRAITS